MDKFQIVDALGNIQMELVSTSAIQSIDVTQLSSGTYFLKTFRKQGVQCIKIVRL